MAAPLATIPPKRPRRQRRPRREYVVVDETPTPEDPDQAAALVGSWLETLPPK